MFGRAIQRVAALAAPVAVAVLVGYFIWLWNHYLRFPSFVDQGEASIAMLALDVGSGNPLYHALDAAPRTSLVYGPSMYLVHAAFLAVIDDPILATKLAGIVLCFGGFLLALFSLRAAGARWFWVLALYILVVLLGFSNVSYWNRSDPLILFCLGVIAVIGPYVDQPRYRTAATIGLGLALATLTNAKIHGGLYALPMLYWYLRTAGRSAIAGTILTTMALTVAPFVLLPGTIPFSDFITWLTVTADHPRDATLLPENFVLLGEIVAPVVAIAIVGWRSRSTAWQVATILLIGVGVLLCGVAAKAGAGVPHLLPFGFTAAWLAAQGLAAPLPQPSWGPRALAAVLLATTAFGLGHRAFQNQRFMIKFGLGAEEWQMTAAAVAELHRIVDAYPGASFSMGYGDSTRVDRPYRLSYLKPLLHDRGRINFVDAPALMDMQLAGLAIPPATLRFLESQKVDIFLLPAGDEPFAKTSYYDGRELFGADFRRIFAENYMKRETREFFAVWTSSRFASLPAR